jgi:tetratricopeptide (TPR) repeat protein
MINWADGFVKNDLAVQTNALNAALSYSPQNNILLFNLARTKYLMDDFAGTVHILQPLVEGGWGYAPAHYLLGASYNARGKYSDARRVFEHSLNLNNLYPTTYALLASLSVRSGDSLAADRYEIKYLQEARAAGIPQGVASATIGGVYLADGFGQRALRHYDVAVIQNPRNAQFHEERGEAYEQSGDSMLAEQCYMRALECDSLQPGAHLRLGRFAERRNKTAEAVNHYTLYLHSDSTSGDAREVRARMSSIKQNTSSQRP